VGEGKERELAPKQQPQYQRSLREPENAKGTKTTPKEGPHYGCLPRELDKGKDSREWSLKKEGVDKNEPVEAPETF